MTTKLLADFKAFCHYDAATESFIVDSDINGYLTATESATIGANGDPQGVNFAVKVVYRDAGVINGIPLDFERMTATYSLDGGVVSFQRLESKAKNTGFNGVFDSGTSNLIIFGVSDPAVSDGDLVVVHPEKVPSIISSIAANTTMANDIEVVTDEVVITPKLVSSMLRVDMSCYVEIDYTSAAFLGGLLYTAWNEGGVWNRAVVGYILNAGGGSDQFLRLESSFSPVNLTSANLDVNGDWRLRVEAALVYDNLRMSVDKVKINCIEHS